MRDIEREAMNYFHTKTLTPEMLELYKRYIHSKTNINVFTGAELERRVNSYKQFSHRDYVKQIVSYVHSDSRKVLALYGLRRTGKTVSMYHAISQLPISKCTYVECTTSIHFDTLLDVLKGIKTEYIFIDEITNCLEFSDDAAILSSLYTEANTKVVIAGTDSLRICIASRHALFDRVDFIHTTFSTFWEYKRLHPSTTLDMYLCTGTVQTADIFLSLESCEKYIQDAIVTNMSNTLSKSEEPEYTSLRRKLTEGELAELVYKCINNVGSLCAESTIRRLFKENTLNASLKSKNKESNILLVNATNNHKKYATDLGFIHDFNTRNDVQPLSETIRRFLLWLDIIDSVEEYSFSAGTNYERGILLLSGMQYRLASGYLERFIEDNSNGYSIEIIDDAKRIVFNTLLGNLLEDFVMYHTLLVHKHVLKIKFDGGEFDMLVYDENTNSCTIYEIKHSASIAAEQGKYLLNESFLNLVEGRYGKIMDRIVLYNGDNKDLPNGLKYRNVEEYLLSLEEVHK